MIHKIIMEFLPGSNIDSSISKAKTAAENYNCPVFFKFNGVVMRVAKNDIVQDKLNEYSVMLRANSYIQEYEDSDKPDK